MLTAGQTWILWGPSDSPQCHTLNLCWKGLECVTPEEGCESPSFLRRWGLGEGCSAPQPYPESTRANSSTLRWIPQSPVCWSAWNPQSSQPLQRRLQSQDDYRGATAPMTLGVCQTRSLPFPVSLPNPTENWKQCVLKVYFSLKTLSSSKHLGRSCSFAVLYICLVQCRDFHFFILIRSKKYILHLYLICVYILCVYINIT